MGQDTRFLVGQIPGYPCHATVLSWMIWCELPVCYRLPAPTLSLSSANKIGASCLGAEPSSWLHHALHEPEQNHSVLIICVLYFISAGRTCAWPEVGFQTFCMCRGLPQDSFRGGGEPSKTWHSHDSAGQFQDWRTPPPPKKKTGLLPQRPAGQHSEYSEQLHGPPTASSPHPCWT